MSVENEPVDAQLAAARRLALEFSLPPPILVGEFRERGNINQHTYLVTAGPCGSRREYILQCVNSSVFTRPDLVMQAMVGAIHAQCDHLALRPLPADEAWEPVRLVPTRDGAPYLQTTRGGKPECWRVMVRILGCETFKSLGEILDPTRRIEVAEETGRGLALWGDLTSAMDPASIADPLPGYRNTAIYLAQLDSVLAGSRTFDDAQPWLPQDPVVLHSTGKHFLQHLPPDQAAERRSQPGVADLLDLVAAEREFALALHRDVRQGRIRAVAIHGDTKIDNFLFDLRSRRVRSLVDLDTIMSQTWLADWGDMVRSLCNMRGEKEPDPSRVEADMDLYRALAAGFLGTARNVQPAEVARMVDAVETIAIELGVRFLSDFLRGDSYFTVTPDDPWDLNLTRARCQLALFRSLRGRRAEAEDCIREHSGPASGRTRRAIRRRAGARRIRPLVIGTSWVRGVVGEALTPELVARFAGAFGTWCGGGSVVVGHDTRRSSAMLYAAVKAGLIATGCRVLDTGVTPTPAVAHTVRAGGHTGGLVVTGSHNEARWNALKFIGPEGALLNATKSEEVLDIYHAASYTRCETQQHQPVTVVDDEVDAYVAHLVSSVDGEAIRSRRFRVAIDFCNGACHETASLLLDRLGCDLLALNETPTGEFAHAPAPSVVNMRQLAAFMREQGADIGASINIDGDRAAFLTADGTPLSEECTFPLVARNALFTRPGPVVTSFSTSRTIDHVARQFGEPVIRTYVGEGHTIDAGLAEGAVVAGEGSGGVAVLHVGAAFDGLAALASMLEAMARSGSSLEALASALPRFPMRKGEIPCPADVVSRVVEVFCRKHEADGIDCRDGVRVEWPDAFLHVRGSFTEPIIRVIVEADTPDRADTIFSDAMARARLAAAGD